MRRLLFGPRALLRATAAAAARFGAAPVAAPRPYDRTSARSLEDPDAGAPTPRPTASIDGNLVKVVQSRPGITVAEAAELLRVHPTELYPVIRRLETDERIVKLGRELHLARRRGAAIEQLWCEAGHPWTRAAARGRKPRTCPQHRASRSARQV